MATIKDELMECFEHGDKNEVENVWNNHRKYDTLEKKIKILRKCMGNPQTFYSCNETPSPEEAYAIELEVFFLGEWQLTKYYKAMAGVKYRWR